MTGPEPGMPSPIVHRNPAPTGLRPRTSVKQVVSGVLSPGRQLAAKLDQKRRALIPFGGAGSEQGEERAAGSAEHSAARPAPTLPEAYDIDLDSDPDLATGDLEGLG